MPLPWAYEEAELSYEGSPLRFSKLDNGLRIDIAKTDDPRSICKLSLLVKVGSLVENEKQTGMAHFVEHMVFRNSENFPNHELYSLVTENYGSNEIKINAETSRSFTRYNLTLLTCSEPNLQKAVQIVADIAYRVRFREEDVKLEKTIVNAEETSTHFDLSSTDPLESWIRHNHRKKSKQLWPFSRLKEDILGTKNKREEFTAEALTEFYRTWYRPEHMAVVFAGYDQNDLVKKFIIKEWSAYKHQGESPVFSALEFLSTEPSYFTVMGSQFS